MNKFFYVLIVFFVMVSSVIKVSAQIKANRFTDKDNVPVPERAKILPMNSYNFLKEEYTPSGTKTYVDTISIDEKPYIIFSYGIQNKEDNEHKSFFTLLVKIRDTEDFMKLVTNNCLYSSVTSRNHPDYICQGTLKREEYSIDFVAFTSSKASTAIINNKIFDLSKGNLILLTEDPNYKFIVIDRQIPFEEHVPMSTLKEQLKKTIKNQRLVI